MKNIHIIGGGTSGWLTALSVQKIFPNSNLTLIESKSIGIIGVGEGTTPNFVELLKKLNIDINDFESKTNQTKKIGICFRNWPGDDTFYNHDFSNKITAYHIDAQTFSEYFKNIAIQRGVSHIEDDVLGFDTDFKKIKNKKETHVNKIKLKSGDDINTDFIFDCSGFGKLIIDKVMKSEWVSVKEYLTVDSAITFHLPNDKKLISYKDRTDSTTMKCGWLWKIPLKNRIGAGYVFNSKYTSDEDAKKEIQDLFETPIDFKKKISFESGYFNNLWVGNCISVGLSGGFFEPIEATSIMTAAIELVYLMDNKLNYNLRTSFNNHMRNVNNEILDFIRYHYVCDRKDTEFWSDYQNIQLTKKLSSILDENRKLSISRPKELLFKNKTSVFSFMSYQVLNAGNFIKRENLI